MKRDLDLVLFGATGFTGRHAAARLRDTAPAGLCWGIAGRNRNKLEELHSSLGLSDDVRTLVADSVDRAAVGAMAGRARVLLSTAGPFARYGTAVFEACVEHKTHYADITGETVWARHMIDRHHARAKDDGTVLVPFSGYDSIPSDLGTWLLVRHLREQHDQETRQVYASFRSRGGFSGGTVATALLATSLDRDERRLAMNPYTLCPDVEKPRVALDAEGDPRRPIRTLDGDWDAPNVMGPINTRVVRRSASLFGAAGAPYGAELHYQEGLRVDGGSRVAACLATGALAIGLIALSSRAVRPVVERLLPASGEGPSEQQINSGRTRARFVAEGARGTRARLFFDYAGDPAIRFTVLSLVESGLLLASGGARFGAGERGRGGVLTPAFAFGEQLVDKLRARDVRMELTG